MSNQYDLIPGQDDRYELVAPVASVNRSLDSSLFSHVAKIAGYSAAVAVMAACGNPFAGEEPTPTQTATSVVVPTFTSTSTPTVVVEPSSTPKIDPTAEYYSKLAEDYYALNSDPVFGPIVANIRNELGITDTITYDQAAQVVAEARVRATATAQIPTPKPVAIATVTTTPVMTSTVKVEPAVVSAPKVAATAVPVATVSALQVAVAPVAKTDTRTETGKSTTYLEVGSQSFEVRYDAESAVVDAGGKRYYESAATAAQDMNLTVVVAHDDIRLDFVKEAHGSQVALTPILVLEPNFNPANLTPEQRALAKAYGINVDQGEILGQLIYKLPIKAGESLKGRFEDNPELRVNVGATIRYYGTEPTTGEVTSSVTPEGVEVLTIQGVDGQMRVMRVGSTCTVLTGSNTCPNVRVNDIVQGKATHLSVVHFPFNATLSGTRLVCDDSLVRLIKLGPKGEMTDITDQANIFPAGYDYSQLSQETRDYLERIGINVKDGELLAQITLPDMTFEAGESLAALCADTNGGNVGFNMYGHVAAR